jgi:hypothetical protein
MVDLQLASRLPLMLPLTDSFRNPANAAMSRFWAKNLDLVRNKNESV